MFAYKKKQNKGFTLIELIIAVAIVSLLATTAVTTINPAKRIGDANDAQRQSDITTVMKAIDLYTADNGSLPSDISSANIGANHKVVLCSSAAELTCDGQTRDCLVVDDTDFLGDYLADLPVDPEKSADTDTGYYITRTDGDLISFGACSSYSDTGVVVHGEVELPAYTTICGDGVTEGDEICDDGNNDVEACGDGATQNGDYCNADCTAVLTLSEVCDDGDTYTEACGNGILESGTNYCNADCTATYNGYEDCDWDVWSDDCYNKGWLTDSDVGGGYCNSVCRNVTCIPMPG